MSSAAYVRNAWYAAATSAEVGRNPLARTLLDQRVVLWRAEAGDAMALRDRCAHRFAPLSMGTVEGDAVACPYHGMAYDGQGTCVRLPGQDTIPAAARVQSFPVTERYGLVFLWMGDPVAADPKALVEIPQYGQTDWGLSRGYSVFGACWENIIDNLIDPAHTSFVHQRTIGNDAGEDVRVTADEHDGTIRCGRWVDDAPPVPVVQKYARLEGKVDRWQFYYLKAPCTSWVDFGSMPAGRPHTPQEQGRAPFRMLSYAFLTPQSRNITHYFSFQLRSFAAGSPVVTAELEALYKVTFEEDRVLLEQIQREEDAHPGLVPVRIASDVGVARLRRRVAILLNAETPS